MQGQKSAIGSLPDSINFDYGSPSSNVGIDQQICCNNLRDPAESRISDYRIAPGGTDAYKGTISEEGRNMSRWSIGESSSSNLQNPINHGERIMAQNGWSSSMSTFSGASQPYEPPSVTSRNGVNLNLNMNRSHDSNDGESGRVGADLMDCSNSSKPGGFEHPFIPSSSSSEPFASSSGSGGFLMEEDGRSGCTLDGRRFSCKRKTIEGNVELPYNSLWQAIPPCYDSGSSSLNISPQLETSSGVNSPNLVNPRLELSMGGSAPCNLHTSSAGSGAESSQRNYRVRTNPYSQQDSLPNNLFPASNLPLRLVPVNPSLELVTPVLPGLRRNIQSARLNGASRSWGANLSPSLVSREGDAPLNEDLNLRPLPRNIPEHHMFISSGEIRTNVAHNPPNSGLDGGGVSLTRHVGSGSRAGSGLGSHSTSGLNWGSSHRHPPSQYSRRLSDYVRRSLISSAGTEIGGHGGSSSGHRSVPSSSQELLLPSGGGSQRLDQPFSRSAHWMDRNDRNGDGVIGLPYSLRPLSAAGEGRSRLVSEVRNVLDIMRRGEGVPFEDVMTLDPSVFFGMADIHDQHRDMRLDVDGMSYEELLALEDRIGNVCTGLSTETIAARMKQRKYISLMKDDQAEIEPCCICQEEYSDGEDLGTLDCGHDFHRVCIKQWLAQKNLCPICKTTALST